MFKKITLLIICLVFFISTSVHGASLIGYQSGVGADVDADGNLKVNIVTGGFSGSVTTADNVIPTDAINVVSHLKGWDGTNWDRIHIDSNGSVYSNPGASSYTTDSTVCYPPATIAMTHISTATSTIVKSAAAGYLFTISVNKADTSANTATVYDFASCTNPTGVIGVIDTTVPGNVDYNPGGTFSNGLCIVTTGTADITVVTK